VRTVFTLATVLAVAILATFIPYALRTDLSTAVEPDTNRQTGTLRTDPSAVESDAN